MLTGIDVPGYKLVEGRRGNRAWTDEKAVLKALRSYRFKNSEMYDYKLISPAKAEKLLKKFPRRWNRVGEFTSRADGKISVAAVTDKRPALVVENVADAFRDLDDVNSKTEN